MTTKAQWLFGTGKMDLFVTLGEGEHDRRGHVKWLQGSKRCVELPLAAIDQQDVGWPLLFF